MKTKWEDLPYSIQMDVMNYYFDNMLAIGDLSDTQIIMLNSLTPNDLFTAWCNWNGFINWGDTITRVFKSIHANQMKGE